MTLAAKSELDRDRTRLVYERDASRYLQSLPLEHFMESTEQSTQRKIALKSFDVIARYRPDIQCFSELLIQYVKPGEDPDKPSRVVPDNMVIVHEVPIEASGSFMAPIQPVGPTLVLEYVSKSNERKDYEESYRKYERELKVPFYLVFNADAEELHVFRSVKGRFQSVELNEAGRCEIPDLELEAALLDGWVRFWFRGKLVPPTGDLVDQVEEERAGRLAERKSRLAEERGRKQAEQERDALAAELARLRESINNAK